MHPSRSAGRVPAAVLSCLGLAALGLLPACSSAPDLDRVSALDLIQRFPVDYSGTLTSAREESGNEGSGRLLPRPDEETSRSSVGVVDGEGGPLRSFQVEVRLLAMSPDVATRFLGFDVLPKLAGGTPAGGTVLEEGLDLRIDELVEAGFATELGSPSLVVTDGISGRYDAESREQYLEGFELAVDGARFMADPQVEEVRSGLEMVLRVSGRDGESASERFDCQIAMKTSVLVGGLHEVESRLPSGGRLALQVPVFLRQHLRADAALAPGQTMVVVGVQLPESGEVLVVFVDPFARFGLQDMAGR